jgi:hypothetical protein
MENNNNDINNIWNIMLKNIDILKIYVKDEYVSDKYENDDIYNKNIDDLYSDELDNLDNLNINKGEIRSNNSDNEIKIEKMNDEEERKNNIYKNKNKKIICILCKWTNISIMKNILIQEKYKLIDEKYKNNILNNKNIDIKFVLKYKNDIYLNDFLQHLDNNNYNIDNIDTKIFTLININHNIIPYNIVDIYKNVDICIIKNDNIYIKYKNKNNNYILNTNNNSYIEYDNNDFQDIINFNKYIISPIFIIDNLMLYKNTLPDKYKIIQNLFDYSGLNNYIYKSNTLFLVNDNYFNQKLINQLIDINNIGDLRCFLLNHLSNNKININNDVNNNILTLINNNINISNIDDFIYINDIVSNDLFYIKIPDNSDITVFDIANPIIVNDNQCSKNFDTKYYINDIPFILIPYIINFNIYISKQLLLFKNNILYTLDNTIFNINNIDVYNIFNSRNFYDINYILDIFNYNNKYLKFLNYSGNYIN